MAEVKRALQRPVSPHLTIYRPLINMVMSILHRITGIANYVGTVLLAVWLFAAASGERPFDAVNQLFRHPLGQLILLGYTWSVLHHMLGGIRHLIWDTGRGLEIWSVNLLSWLTISGSLALTAAIWSLALFYNGGL
jgi:succinate dehydrogenase / fumarate reductase cytochrome b subunit